ncbi:MAG: DNA mismatch repair protein MutS, partial [Spirochaetaceae bacterium]|nr:DNA mismatch repair protein MutS [Spirochaetaceae bacterium]
GKKQFTLLSVLDRTVTPMGHRFLRNNLTEPLISADEISWRQEKVQFYFDDSNRLNQTRTGLKSILDIERFASRIVMGKANACDFIALKQSLFAYAELVNSGLIEGDNAHNALRMANQIDTTIVDEPSPVFNDGNLIKRGFNNELDKDYRLKENFQGILDEYIEEERRASGIENLKVRYNRKNGYYLEVSRGKLDIVPDYFIRKRSLVNGDRFTTEKLSQLELDCVSVADRIIESERALFFAFRNEFAQNISVLHEISAEVARGDFFSTLAFCAKEYNWVCPTVDDSDLLMIKNGRHPVVENNLPIGEFVPNDLTLDEKFFALITGPNMAGKSTFLRQSALMVILAQIGSFIPAEEARIGIVKRIFCRVGAQDNLANGESTFLVEMNETGNILRNATSKSLILMDEIGRGTSTEDGLSIAQAVMEFLLDVVGAKTLFATHYHELTRIEHPKMTLLCPDVVEENDNVIFTRKMNEGASKNSYGIHVAKLAGLPSPVILRATQLLNKFLSNKGESHPVEKKISQKKEVLPSSSLFPISEIILNELSSVDCNKLTPLEALMKISRWQEELR